MANQTMRALTYHPASGDLKIQDLPLPDMEADEVLVRITRVAFTRRDRLLLEDRSALPPDGGDFIIPCHVAVGKVVETGPMVREFKTGDVVVPTIRRDCDRCIDARSDLCPHPEQYRDSGLKGAHGFARDFLSIRSRYLVKVPSHLEHLALLLAPLSLAEKAHQEAIQLTKRYSFYCYHEMEGAAPRALITGMGSVGIMTAYLLSLYNYKLTVFCRRESDDDRLRLLEPLDVDYINTQRVPTERLEKAGYSFRQIFETTGDPQYSLRIMNFMAPNAIMALMASPEWDPAPDNLEVDIHGIISRIVLGNQMIFGSIKSGRDAFESAVKHLEELADLYGDALAGLMTQTLPLAQYRSLLALGTREAIIPALQLV